MSDYLGGGNNSTIITIEKGVRAISRFFTHGLEDEGRKHYGNFGSFILLRDEDLGKLKYLRVTRKS